MSSNSSSVSLTSYPRGSLPELWALSWPMMLSALAGHFMIFADRMILSRYSQTAFVAATASQSWYWAISLSLMALVGITEVFVGGYNGAKEYPQIRKVVWQMIWVSFLSWGILLPLILFAPLLLPSSIQEAGTPYLQVLIFFLPFYLAGFGAIGSFFVGRGETKIIPIVLVTSNFLNIGLDIWFIFGGWFLPSMGVVGAAYATGISQFLAFLFFLAVFLRRRYRESFQTHKLYFSWGIMSKCFSVGGPIAFSAFINLVGWSLVYQMLVVTTTPDQLFAYTISHSVFAFFWFVLDGVGKGICAVCANGLGQKDYKIFYTVIRSFLKLCLLFALITSIFMVFFPELVVFAFAKNPSYHLVDRSRVVLFWAWIAISFECIWWGFQNMLVSAGDTRYVTLATTLPFWFVSLLPIFLLVFLQGWDPSVCWMLLTLDLFVRIFLLVKRLRGNRWEDKLEAIQRVED